MSAHKDDIELILQDSLEQIQSGQTTLEGILEQYPDRTGELRPLLETALWLRVRRTTLDPRPGFVRASRRRVLEQIRQEQTAGAVPIYTRGVVALGQFLRLLTTHRRLAFQYAVVFILALGMVFGSAGVARGAQGSLPGDALYRVKIVMENASLALARDEGEKAELHIRYAQRRLEEIQALIAGNHLDQIADAVVMYEEHINQAIRHMIAVQGVDQEQANQLALRLHAMMERDVDLFRQLAGAESESVGEQIERVLLVSAGVVELLEETVTDVPLPAIAIYTPTLLPASMTPSATQAEVAIATVAHTETALPSATPSLTVAVFEPPAAAPSITATPTLTATLVAVEDEEEVKPTKTAKPTKTPKPKKDKDKDKDLPEPTRRPVKPPNDR